MEATRNKRGAAHENGSIEGPRGLRDFEELDAYRRFIAEVVGRANAYRTRAREANHATLWHPPVGRTVDCEQISVNIASSSGFGSRRVFYTVPSNLIGHRLRGRVYDDRIELFLSGSLRPILLTFPPTLGN